MLVSGIQQSDLDIYIYVCMYVYSLFGFFSIRVYYRMQNIVPCAIQHIIVVHLFLKIILFIFGCAWSSLLCSGFL